MLERPPIIDKAVDFPALHGRREMMTIDSTRGVTHPLDPNNAKMPVFGISRLKFETAVTSPLELNLEVL
jgi:hypothetical protein